LPEKKERSFTHDRMMEKKKKTVRKTRYINIRYNLLPQKKKEQK
jgi:hypothetical protein